MILVLFIIVSMLNTWQIYSGAQLTSASLITSQDRKHKNALLFKSFTALNLQLFKFKLHQCLGSRSAQFLVPRHWLVPASGTLTMTKISAWTKKPSLFSASTPSRQKGTDIFWNQTNSILFVGLQRLDHTRTHRDKAFRNIADVMDLYPMEFKEISPRR